MSDTSKDVGETLLTVADLMRKTGWSRQTIYNKVSAGEIPAMKLGRSLRFRRSEIDEWFSELLASREPAL